MNGKERGRGRKGGSGVARIWREGGTHLSLRERKGLRVVADKKHRHMIHEGREAFANAHNPNWDGGPPKNFNRAH